MTQSQYYEDLAAQLIDNNFDTVGMRPRSAPDANQRGDGPLPPRYGVGVHLTPTLKRRAGASAKDADQRAQRVCHLCKQHRTTMVFSRCRESKSEEHFFCAPNTGRHCFDFHMREVHQFDV